MSDWKALKTNEKPSPNFVLVKNISKDSSEKTVKEFFTFCGKIKSFELKDDKEENDKQVALIEFERESAAKTAALLSNALIDDSHITAKPYFDSAAAEAPATEGEKASGTHTPQEDKPKSRIAAEYLASGYMLQDQIVAKALECDQKFGLSSRFQGYLETVHSNAKQVDDKYRIWDKAVEIDQKYKIQEKVQNIAQTAQTKVQAALETPTGQKAQEFANQTYAQISAVHFEAKRIQNDKQQQQPQQPAEAK